MADVNTAIYQPLQTPQQNPLQVLQMLGALNQAKLFSQEFNARQAIGQAYRDNTGPNGELNTPGLRSQIGQTGGFLAGEGLSQATANSSADAALKSTYQGILRQTFGQLATKPVITDQDINTAKADAARQGVPGAFIQDYADTMPMGGSRKGQAALKDWAVSQSNLSRGPEAIAAGTTVPGPKGAPYQISEGAASRMRNAGGLQVGMQPGFNTAQESQATQGAASANALSAANDSSMVRKGMLGNLEEDLSKFTAGPGADWTKVAKSWVNRNVPLPQGWQFDPKSIASQEQFNKQAAMLAQQQFQAIGGTGTDAKFDSAFTTSPNETLSQLGNKGIIRLLKGNEDAIQAKNKAWQNWKRSGNGPDTYQDFSEQFNDHFDPRAFQFKYLPQEERQAYVDKMDPNDRARFLHDLTFARKNGWIQFEQPKQ